MNGNGLVFWAATKAKFLFQIFLLLGYTDLVLLVSEVKPFCRIPLQCVLNTIRIKRQTKTRIQKEIDIGICRKKKESNKQHLLRPVLVITTNMWFYFGCKMMFYPPASEANLTERKICIPPYMVSKNLLVCLPECLSSTCPSVINFDLNYLRTGKTEWPKKFGMNMS